MIEHKVKIISTEYVTHDVKKFLVERPDDYSYEPGQATEVSINKPGFENEKRPFTFTGLNDWPQLEFIIKTYKNRDGVTDELSRIQPGEELILRDVWGAITYKGPGVFLAAGAGVTPFIAILRHLEVEGELKGNKLYFSNKRKKDIILEHEFKNMLGDNFYCTLTRETDPEYDTRRIDESFLKEKIDDFNQNFYVCGPPGFVKEVNNALKNLGAKSDSIIFEE